MTEQELREKIGIEIAIAYELGIKTQPISVPTIVKNILALIKEAGYVKLAKMSAGETLGLIKEVVDETAMSIGLDPLVRISAQLGASKMLNKICSKQAGGK